MSLVIRNVEVDGRAGLDVRIEADRISQIGPRLAGGEDELDGQGGALIPGLCDHHIHLFALAARADSVDLSGATTEREFRARLAEAVATRPAGGWIRVIGYHEAMGGGLDRAALDALAPAHRVRVQHQTGSLWMLNSAALKAVAADDGPSPVERDERGRPTGRIWRGDAWLRSRTGAEAPPLGAVGRKLAAYGITALTDASVTTDRGAAARMADAHRSGDLPQRLTLMSGGALATPPDGAYAVGPLKVLLDDHALLDIGDFQARIGQARRWGRKVAVHCVTAAELALTLAAFESAGTEAGDRIEHGGVIPLEAVERVRDLGLTIVTQPAFISERGDRYLAEVDAADQPDLYRCASLLAAGVPVAGSSDAPYTAPDPWAAMAAAVERRSRSGRAVAADERVDAATALSLYLDEPAAPGRVRRRVEVGAAADLCLLKVPLTEALGAPSAALVAATLIGGRVV